jgi:hypothetical protein
MVMPIFHKATDNNQHKLQTYHRSNANAWHYVKNCYYKLTDAAWHPIYSYEWIPSPWGPCTVNCGGGTQTRGMTCRRNDGIDRPDIFCDDLVKPPMIQECNTQSCAKPITISWTGDDGAYLSVYDLGYSGYANGAYGQWASTGPLDFEINHRYQCNTYLHNSTRRVTWGIIISDIPAGYYVKLELTGWLFTGFFGFASQYTFNSPSGSIYREGAMDIWASSDFYITLLEK